MHETPLIDRPLRELLDVVASATPAPGGGASAGWACALAASLVEMAATFGLKHSRPAEDRSRMAETVARAQALRERATELAQEDLHTYEPVLRALRMPKDDPERAAHLDAALSQAAEIPLAIARAAAEVSALALEVSRGGSPHLRGDALAGLHIADGACQAAARLVEINLAGRPDDQRISELARVTAAASAAAASAAAALSSGGAVADE